ncbi:hypothetical protein PTKIN_Ptkin18bG0103200 [Pterospermum kingtungense]
MPTMDILANWGLAVNPLCCLCQTVGTWTEELNWAIQHAKGKSMSDFILRFAWKASIYFLWRERNRRCHGHSPASIQYNVSNIKATLGQNF